VQRPPSDEWDHRGRRHPAGLRATLRTPLLLAAGAVLLRMAHPWRWLTSPCVVLRVCACSATVLACSSSEGNSNIRASASTAPASLLRARSCSTLLSASPAAPLAALLCACSLQFRCSYSQTRVRLFYPLSSIREDSSLSSSDHLGARTCVARASSVAPAVPELCPFDCGFPGRF
jgi:hypothetical protein